MHNQAWLGFPNTNYPLLLGLVPFSESEKGEVILFEQFLIDPPPIVGRLDVLGVDVCLCAGLQWIVNLSSKVAGINTSTHAHWPSVTELRWTLL